MHLYEITHNDTMYLCLLDMYNICMATILLVLTYDGSFSYLNGGCITGLLLNDIVNKEQCTTARINLKHYMISKLLAPDPAKHTLNKHFEKHIDTLPNLKKILGKQAGTYEGSMREELLKNA